MSYRYGRLPAHPESTHPRVHLADYIPAELRAATLPGTIDWASRVSQWPMYANDSIGDCTCATVGHEIQAFTAFANSEVTLPVADIVDLYSQVSGYNQQTGANDNGAVIQDVLQYWHDHGVAGHKISAFASVNIASVTDMRLALRWFGSVYLGVNVPQSAEDQFSANQPWTVDPNANNTIIGGHAIPIQEWDPAWMRIVTWGKLQEMSYQWFQSYCEEAWVVITPDFLKKSGLEASGVSLAQLTADFKALGGNSYT